ncbi:MAG: serine/threonine protein kinase [Myxococcota bacterium]
MNCKQCGQALDGSPHKCVAASPPPPPRISEHTVIHHVRPGELLDQRWRIETRIGQGAMGAVYAGIDQVNQRKVAIKILSPEHCRKPKVLARFEREAALMTTLRHPNIVQLYGLGRRGALPFIVMQFLQGKTLFDTLKERGGKLPPVEMLNIVRQICSGLSFIHHHGLVHRDIKPQNIFLGPDGKVTILDLGVARDKSNPGLTKPGALVGTPYYMSPEQISGHREIDRRTDVYALGAVVFELLTGTPPFVGNNNFEVLRAHRTQPPPSASERSAFVPKPVSEIIERALAKNPDDRPQNVHELLVDIEANWNLEGEATNPGFSIDFEKRKVATAKAKPRSSPRPPAKKSLPAPDTLGEPSMVDSGEVELLSSDPMEKTLGSDGDDQAPEGASTSEGSDPENTVQESGELRIITTVNRLTSSATLFVDGEKKGGTPVSLQLPAGTHEIRIERAGFRPEKRQVSVTADQVTLLRLELEKADAHAAPKRRGG